MSQNKLYTIPYIIYIFIFISKIELKTKLTNKMLQKTDTKSP